MLFLFLLFPDNVVGINIVNVIQGMIKIHYAQKLLIKIVIKDYRLFGHCTDLQKIIEAKGVICWEFYIYTEGK